MYMEGAPVTTMWLGRLFVYKMYLLLAQLLDSPLIRVTT